MRALALLVLACLQLVAAPASASGERLACGGFAPFATECSDGPVIWGSGGAMTVEGSGSVGMLEVRLEWDHGTYTVRCVWPSPDAPDLSLRACATEGRPPPAGALVTLRCRVAEHPTLRLPPVGPWGCVVTSR